MADRYDDRYRTDAVRGERWHHPREDRYARDRSVIDRAGDEMRSWFGDDEAERRRRMDEHRYGRDYPREHPERDHARDDRGEYARDWDYGHRMGFDYDRTPPHWHYANDWGTRGAGPRTERGWSNERWGYAAQPAPPISAPYPPREYHVPYTGYREYRDTGRYGPGSDQGRGMDALHTGRGPRGYQRSDERIREDVCDRLADDPWVDASEVEVTVRGGEVTLAGSVPDRHDKRRAEDLLDHISGVREVHNTLRVGAGSGLSTTTGATVDRSVTKTR